MLIHERFVFLHMPKTAGIFLGDALGRELPQDSLHAPQRRQHAGWDEIPDYARDRPVLGYVRNPWDWYVSWYHFLRGYRPDNAHFNRFSANGANDFAATVRNACAGAPAGGGDFYTFRFRKLAGAGLSSDCLTIGRFETLFDDLELFLAGAGVTISDRAMTRMRQGKPQNDGPHRPYREYYDDELRDFVGDSCRTLVERFDYSF